MSVNENATNLKVACYGAGYFSQFHFDGWKRIPDVDLMGVSNRDRSKAEATGLPVFDTLDEMLTRTSPDILDIIVSPAGHGEALRTALKHPLKAIICQKPFCASKEEANEMIALAKMTGIPIIVHENFRFQPWYRAIKTQMDAGAIGTPLQATFRLRPGDGQGPDAYLARQPYFQKMPRLLIHETGVHYVDTFRFMFGNPTAVYADLRKMNPVIAGEDAGTVIFDHEDGLRTILDGNRLLDHPTPNTRCTMGEGFFEGTQGTLVLYGDGSVTLRQFGEIEETKVLGADTSQTFGGDCTYALQAHVVSGLLHGTELENLAQDYLTVIEIEEAIYQSAQSQSKVKIAT